MPKANKDLMLSIPDRIYQKWREHLGRGGADVLGSARRAKRLAGTLHRDAARWLERREIVIKAGRQLWWDKASDILWVAKVDGDRIEFTACHDAAGYGSHKPCLK